MLARSAVQKSPKTRPKHYQVSVIGPRLGDRSERKGVFQHAGKLSSPVHLKHPATRRPAPPKPGPPSGRDRDRRGTNPPPLCRRDPCPPPPAGAGRDLARQGSRSA